MPGVVGFQADLAHTYLYLLGYNAPEHALLKAGHSHAEFVTAYTKMTDALRPWTLDFHVAQNDGTVHGSGSHDKTGRHCRADDPNGKLDEGGLRGPSDQEGELDLIVSGDREQFRAIMRQLSFEPATMEARQ